MSDLYLLIARSSEDDGYRPVFCYRSREFNVYKGWYENDEKWELVLDVIVQTKRSMPLRRKLTDVILGCNEKGAVLDLDEVQKIIYEFKV